MMTMIYIYIYIYIYYLKKYAINMLYEFLYKFKYVSGMYCILYHRIG